MPFFISRMYVCHIKWRALFATKIYKDNSTLETATSNPQTLLEKFTVQHVIKLHGTKHTCVRAHTQIHTSKTGEIWVRSDGTINVNILTVTLARLSHGGNLLRGTWNFFALFFLFNNCMWINNYLKIRGLIKNYMQKTKIFCLLSFLPSLLRSLPSSLPRFLRSFFPSPPFFFYLKKSPQRILKSSKCWKLEVQRLHMWFCLFSLGKSSVLNDFEFEKCYMSSTFCSDIQSHELSLCLFYEFKFA